MGDSFRKIEKKKHTFAAYTTIFVSQRIMKIMRMKEGIGILVLHSNFIAIIDL
jgi:hypothetical protein